MNALLTTNQPLTMTSEQIAELLDLRHDNVRQAATNLKSHGVITFTESIVKGAGRPKQVMHFDKRNSMVIAAKLNDKLMANVIDRWLELEAQEQPQFNIPQTLPEALQLAADLAKEIEENKPKIAVYEQLADRKTDVSTTLLAKQLGTTAIKLNRFLRDQGVKMQQIDAPKAGYQDWLNVISDVKNGHEFTQCLVTPHGQIEITKLWQKHN